MMETTEALAMAADNPHFPKWLRDACADAVAQLADFADERRTQYLTPQERARHQDALNTTMRHALDNMTPVTPNVRVEAPTTAPPK